MINYLNIHNVWDITENRYILRFDENTNKLIVESKIYKKNNDYTVHIIHLVSKIYIYLMI
jgi:hypothetical protein